MDTAKVSSVVELAKHKRGDVLYRVILRRIGIDSIEVPPGEEWMTKVHPKIFYKRGLASKSWKFKGALPKLCGADFAYVTELLTNEPVVERFVVDHVVRSSDTGEFYYGDQNGDYMEESDLFESPRVAKQEKARLKRLFREWSERQSPDEI